MPGAYEISRTIDAVRNSRDSRDFVVLPLHGELPVDQQDAAVARYDRRKVIVSTNVAETSLTIDGVRVVIDSGLAKIARFDPYRGDQHAARRKDQPFERRTARRTCRSNRAGCVSAALDGARTR